MAGKFGVFYGTRLIRITDIIDISYMYFSAVGSDPQPLVSFALLVVLLKGKPSVFPNRAFLQLFSISYTYYINPFFFETQANNSLATLLLQSFLFSLSINR